MLNEYVIESVRRYEGIGYAERFETTQSGLRSQQTGRVHPVDAFEADHVVALGEPAAGTGELLLFALRTPDGVRGIWLVPRDASLPRDAQRLVQRLLGQEGRRGLRARRLPLGPPRAGDHVLDGGLTGVIGASTVALWFLLLDTLLREPLYTPSVLAARVFRVGGEVPRELTIDLANVATFTMVHGLAFIGLGIAAAWFVARHVERPNFPALFLGLFVLLEVPIALASELWMPEVTRILGHWSIAVGNALSAGGMAVYLRWFQPHPADPREALAPAAARALHRPATKGGSMLGWALTFLVLALIAGLFGLTGLAGAAADIAWILFVVFLVLMLVAAVANAARGRRPPV